MTKKELKKTLNNIFLNLSQSSYTSVSYFEDLPLMEILDWIEVMDSREKMIRKKMGVR